MEKVVWTEKPLGEFKRIPISLIQSGGSREVFEDITNLASTIKRQGLLQPILVRKAEKGYGFVVVCARKAETSFFLQYHHKVSP